MRYGAGIGLDGIESLSSVVYDLLDGKVLDVDCLLRY